MMREGSLGWIIVTAVMSLPLYQTVPIPVRERAAPELPHKRLKIPTGLARISLADLPPMHAPASLDPALFPVKKSN